jgi:hypothetical protein
MKLAPTLLVVSLLVNAAFVATVARSRAPAPLSTTSDERSDGSHETARERLTHRSGLATTTAIGTGTATASRPPVAEGPPALLWSQLQSDDPRTLMQRLQEAGFPRRVVTAVVDDVLQRRVRERSPRFMSDPGSGPYWQRSFPRMTPEASKQYSALWHAYRQQRRDLFGADAILDDPVELARMRAQFGVSDPQKLMQLQTIIEDYQQVQNDAFSDGRTPGRELIQESQQLLQREQFADIAATLTPEELAEYELRASATAHALRGSIREFRASESEYRALFAAYQTAANDPAARGFDPGKLLEQARNILSPERFADLEQALAPGAAKLNRLAARLELPLAAIKPVDVAQRELKERAKNVRGDRALTPEQRAAQLAAIADEATQRISAVLGERGFAAYREYDGSWIGELTTALAP